VRETGGGRERKGGEERRDTEVESGWVEDEVRREVGEQREDRYGVGRGRKRSLAMVVRVG